MVADILRVLVVDDSPTDARFIERMLETSGRFRVATVGSLAECLERLRSDPPDIVTLDLGLPDSSGLATIRSAVAAEPSVPVVAITGTDDEQTGLQALEAGAQDYLAKTSLRPDLLARALRYAVERSRAERALAVSEGKWRHVLERMPQIGIGLDRQGKIIFANDYFLNLTGWTREEILGRDWFETCLPEAIRARVRSVFDSVIAAQDTGDFSTYQNPIITRSGEPRDVAWANVLTRDARGGVVDVTCLGVDLTDRERVQAQLNSQLLELRRWQSVTLDREDRIIELKREVNALAERLGMQPPYHEAADT